MHTTILAIIAACLVLNGLGVIAIDYDRRTMLCLVNKERTQRGLSTLGPNAALDNAAQRHSDDQARMNKMTHIGSDGSDPSKRVTEAGYDWRSVAENVAYGYPDEQTCMAKWMASSGHRANILKQGLTHFGSAMGVSGSTPYYTQNFGGDGKTYHFVSCPTEYTYGNSPAPTPALQPISAPAPAPKLVSAYGPSSAPSPSTDQLSNWTCIKSDSKGCFRWKKCTTKGNKWSCTEKWERHPSHASSPVPAPATYTTPKPAPASKTLPCATSTTAPKATASAGARPTDWTCIKSDSKGCFRWKKCTAEGNKWSCTEKWERHP